MSKDLKALRKDIKAMREDIRDLLELAALVTLTYEQRRAEERAEIDDAVFKATVLPMVGRVDLLKEQNEALKRLLGE